MAQIIALPFNNLNDKEFSLLLNDQKNDLVHFDHDRLFNLVFTLSLSTRDRLLEARLAPTIG